VHAGDRTLKRPQQQLFASDPVEASPPEVHLLMDGCCHITHDGNLVGLAFDERGDLTDQHLILLFFH
jgi:hypothetical protein